MQIQDMLCENKHMAGLITNIKTDNFMYKNQVRNLKKEELNIFKSLSNKISKVKLSLKKKSNQEIPVLLTKMSSPSLQLKNEPSDESEIFLSCKNSCINIPQSKDSLNAVQEIEAILSDDEDIEVIQLFPVNQSCSAPIIMKKDSPEIKLNTSKIPVLIKPSCCLKRNLNFSSNISRKSSNTNFKSRIPIPVNKSKSAPVVSNKEPVRVNILKEKSHSFDCIRSKHRKLTIFTSKVMSINSEIDINPSPPTKTLPKQNLSIRKNSSSSQNVSLRAPVKTEIPKNSGKKRYPVNSPEARICTKKIEFVPHTKKVSCRKCESARN